MLSASYIVCLLFGAAFFAFGFFKIITEVLVDSPFDLFTSIFSPRRLTHTFRLIDSHIRDNWPDTKLIGSIYYGGMALLVLGGILFWIAEYVF
ncbi:MAG TPA: hypothetical protein VMZ27_00610 [Candidatus Saccharimonadales bacterium]|nr:hypothetical protein [Candidatus Saccharimonadales bacterium]